MVLHCESKGNGFLCGNIRAVGLVDNFQKIRAENFAQEDIGLILT